MTRICADGGVRLAVLKRVLPTALGLIVFSASLPAEGGSASPGPAIMSEKPAQSATTTAFEAETSMIEPRLDISYGDVADAANAAADRFAGPQSGRTQIGCKPVRIGSSAVNVTLSEGCAEFDWHVNAQRNGRISVKRDGAGIALAVPVKFAGNGGFEGNLAKAIQINNKTFSGSFVVSISGTVRLDKAFCPKIEATATHFAWNSAAEVDVIGKSCLDMGGGRKACIGPWKLPVGDLFTAQINRSLADQVGEINKKIPCDNIQGQLKQMWKTWSIPVPLGNPAPLYVNIEPKSLAIPGVIAGDNALTLVGRLEATTGVSTTLAPQGQLGVLPDNQPLTSPAGSFSLAVPLAIPYPALAAGGAKNFLGKPIKTKRRRVTITPSAVEFFPSNGTLAIGVSFRAAGSKLAGKSGLVWFSAVPTIENNGHLIRLGNIAITKRDDNPLWPALGEAVGTGLPKAIAASYAYDLSPLVKDAVSKLNQTITDPKKFGGLKVTIANANLQLGRTALLPQTFVVEGKFAADVTMTLSGKTP